LRVFYYFTLRRARKAGKRDGRRWRWRLGLPPWEQKKPYPGDDEEWPTEYERQLYAATENSLHDLARKWHDEDISRKSACDQLCKAYEETTAELQSASTVLDQAQQKYESAKNGYQQIEHPSWSPLIHYLSLVVLGAGEFLTNAIVFRILGEPELTTTIMSLSLLSFLIAGEYVGKTFGKEKIPRKEKVALIIALLLVLAAFVGVSYFRWLYFQASGMPKILGIMPSRMSFVLTFLVFNLFFLIASAIVASWSTPRDPEEFHRARTRLKEAKRELRIAKYRYEELSKNALALWNKLVKAHNSREKRFRRFQEEAEILKNTGADLVLEYRNANMHARGGEMVRPRCFTSIEPRSQIAIPPLFHSLLDCNNCRYKDFISQAPRGRVSLEMAAESTGLVPDTRLSFIGRSSTRMGPLTGPIPVPLILTETDTKGGRAIFGSFVAQANLDSALQKVIENSGLGEKDLCICLDVENPRQDTYEEKWKNAWFSLVNAWNAVDGKAQKAFPKGFVYHLYPHAPLPLAFMLGASVGLRRRIVIYHQQPGRDFFKALELDDPRILFDPPPSDIPAPQKIPLEGEKYDTNRGRPTKLILHIFISDRHVPDFEKHINCQSAASKALWYKMELPEGSWVGYVQNLVKEVKELIQDYPTVDLCLSMPAAIAFALGMAFSRTPKINVCQWFEDQKYRPVFSLKLIEDQVGKIFT
jgi:uncharacterized membrane protein